MNKKLVHKEIILQSALTQCEKQSGPISHGAMGSNLLCELNMN